MGKKKESGWKNVLTGAAIILGTMLLTVGFLSVLLQRGAIGMEGLRVGLMICCLISGTVGILFSSKGKGRLQRILTGLIPSVILLMIGAVLAEKGSLPHGLPIHAAGLFLPSLLSLAGVRSQQRKNVKGRKKHRLKGYAR